MIKDNVSEILKEFPSHVELEAAAKTRTPEEIQEAIEVGIKIIGENYVQEAEEAFAVIGSKARWHFIGHLQKNKAKKAVRIFDIIETVDSFELANELDKACKKEEKTIEIFIEINSGKEKQKFGVAPEKVEELINQISNLENINIKGLMTMGPFTEDPEEARPFFKETKKIFDKIKTMDIKNTEMKHLSMGMSSTYKVAIEEGANIVRIGTKIFGKRE